ncbi:MAG: patatin-like phospholipase family protein [Candidatus Omnitrophica bacterium]|nr:patatin-like phospholipase family protein [Candidatus Omnitrophota bacterium]
MSEQSPSFNNKLPLLKQIPIFQGLNDFVLNRISRHVEIVEYNKGDIICQQGAPADAFYALVSGRVYSYNFNSAGQKEEIGFILRGMHFGIISTLTGESHSCTYEAVNDSIIIRINKDSFSKLLKSAPRLAVALSKSLSQRYRHQVTHTKDAQESTVISVYGPLQGAGSSTYAVNLALGLKEQTNKKVLLLSLSADKAGQRNDLADIPIENGTVLDSITRDALSIDLLSLKFDPQNARLMGKIVQFLGTLVNDYYYIVLDLPSEMDDVVMKMLIQSDVIHLVVMDCKKDLEITRQLIDRLREQLKLRFRADSVQVIISGVSTENHMMTREIKKILNSDVFLILPHLQPVEFIYKEPIPGFAFVEVDAKSEYAQTLCRLARQIGKGMIGLVLGGGAALGLAHIGVIKVLERENIPIDMLVGSSMGALIASLWASGYAADEMEQFGREFENKSGMLELFDPPLERALLIFIIMLILIIFKFYIICLIFMFVVFPLSLPISGVVRGEGIRQWLKGKLGHRTFLDIKIPLKIVVYDLFHRREIVVSDGFLIDAVQKSVAIPGVITPVMEGKQMIIDGGVLNPLPTNVLADMGIKKIIAVNVLQSSEEVDWGQKLEEANVKVCLEIPFDKHPFKFMGFRIGRFISRIFMPNIADIIVRTLQATEFLIAEQSAKQADVHIHPDLRGVSWFELYQVNELIKRGEDAAIKALPAIKELVNR